MGRSFLKNIVTKYRILGLLGCALLYAGGASAQYMPQLPTQGGYQPAPKTQARASAGTSFDDALSAFNYGDNQQAARYLWPLARQGDSRAQYYLAIFSTPGRAQAGT